MIRVAGKFIYLATPSTMSRSVTKALTLYCNGQILGKEHHASSKDLERLSEFTEPVVTFIRDPYDYVVSRYNYNYKNERRRFQNPMNSFILKFWNENVNWNGFGSRICPYRDYVDRYFLFEDGIEPFLEAYDLEVPEIPTEGMRVSNNINSTPGRKTVDDLDDECRAMIEKRFAMELALYRKVKAGG